MTTYDTLVEDARSQGDELVRVERADGHAIVRMHDPQRLNALSAPLTLQLLDALTGLTEQAADMSWDQAITMEEFAEPMCFTTTGHRDAVSELLSS